MTKPTFSDQPATDERQPTHGLCPVCGFLAQLDIVGRITWHFQIRIRRGTNGGAEEYLSQDPCDGLNELPDEVA